MYSRLGRFGGTGVSRRRRGAGFTFIELLTTLAILSTLIAVGLQVEQRSFERDRYNRVGHNVAQVVQALRSYLSANPGLGASTETDLAFLRDSGCTANPGTASDPYLSCEVPDNLGRPGVTYSIVINPGGASGLEARFTTAPIQEDGADRPDLAGRVARVANGFDFQTFTPTSSSTFYQIRSDPSTAVVSAVTSTSPTTDAWVRTDGSNTMNANFTFSNAGGRDINNAATVNAEDVDASNNVSAGQDVSADRDVQAGRDVRADGDVIAQGEVQGTRFVDIDDGSFFVNPAGQSVVDQVLANSVHADEVRSLTTNRTLSQAITDADIIGQNGSYPKPNCPAGQTPELFGSPVRLIADDPSDSRGAVPMHGFFIRAHRENSNRWWRIRTYVLSDRGGRFRPRGGDVRIAVFAKCT